MKNSRDLLLLASVAFKNQQFENAGTLFAASLSADDAEEFLTAVDNLRPAQATAGEYLGAEEPMSLSQIAKVMASALAASVDEDATLTSLSTTVADPTEEKFPAKIAGPSGVSEWSENDDEDGEPTDEELDEEDESDDIDPDGDGSSIMPSSISAASKLEENVEDGEANGQEDYDDDEEDESLSSSEFESLSSSGVSPVARVVRKVRVPLISVIGNKSPIRLKP